MSISNLTACALIGATLATGIGHMDPAGQKPLYLLSTMPSSAVGAFD